MTTITFVGVDFAASDANTALCTLAVEGTTVHAHVYKNVGDEVLLDWLTADRAVVGMDVPFGWPLPFAHLVEGWANGGPLPPWACEPASDLPAAKELLKFRLTDRFVRHYLKARHRDGCDHGTCPWPAGFSVSTDKMGVTTIRAVRLLAQAGVSDRTGSDQRVFEVYPAASLAEWHLYKRKESTATMIARELVAGFGLALESADLTLANHGDFEIDIAKSGDCRDAAVAAMTAWAAWSGGSVLARDLEDFLKAPFESAKGALELTERMRQSWHNEPVEQVIEREGWIHVPNGALDRLELHIP